MNRILEIHALQQFAPANLNRDDTGAPKDAIYGGVRRARISSQSFKRAMRKTFEKTALLDAGELGVRTKRVVARLAELLDGKVKDPTATAEGLVERIGLKLKKDKKADAVAKTEFLLFIGNADLDALAAIGVRHEGKLDSKEAKAAVEELMRSCRAVDVAMFGRMLADQKDFNVDAAAQVAHAISTHKVDREFDFFTAVDDLAQGDEAVSEMLGTVEFNSACYYRYAVLDLTKLAGNLGGDSDLVRKAADAFVFAFARAIPTGKQNTFAAHNPPEFIAIRLRDGTAPINLSSAFESPVRGRDGYMRESVAALLRTQQRFDAAYGGGGETWTLDLTEQTASVGSLEALRERVRSALA